MTDTSIFRPEQRLEAELKEVQRQNREYAKALETQERLIERIRDIYRIEVKPPNLKVAKQNPRLPKRAVVLPIYDLQYGQLVRPEDTPTGIGHFNRAIFDKRLGRYVEGVTGSLRDYAQSHRITEVVLALGGDLVEGDEIFPGQAWQLEIDPPTQVNELLRKLGAAITTIIHFIKEEVGGDVKIGIYCVSGNHGKVGGKKSGARPSTYNWDWQLADLLQDRLRAEPIDQFAIEPGGALFFGAAGHIFLMIHGDEIKGWGGLPFYGLTKFDGRMIRMRHTIYHYLLMGHHHQRAEIPNGGGETIVSGDWVGGNNLSRQLASASRPQQSILFVAPKWGLAETARIYFTDTVEAYAEPTIHRLAA